MQHPSTHKTSRRRLGGQAKTKGHPLAHWLEAERADHAEDAEEALFGVFAALPQTVPTQGFAERVLMAAGVQEVAPAVVPLRARPWSRASRLALAACLVLVAVSGALLLPATLELVALVSPTELVTGVVDGSRTLGHRLHDLSPLWQLATTLYGTVLKVAVSPPVLVLLLSMTLLSSAGLRSLMSLLPTRRSVGYA